MDLDPEAREEAPRRPTLRHRLEYLGARAGAFALLCTDVRGAVRIGRAFGRIVAWWDRRHREIAEDNLRKAYGPALPEAEVRRIARAAFESLGVTGAEFLHGPRRLRGRARRRWFVVEGGAEALRADSGGRLVFLTAHLGNWEYGIAATRTVGFDLVALARPLGNPLVQDWITRVREETGTRTIPKYGGLWGLIRAAREGNSIAMLVDQSAGKYGRVVPFFGRPCSAVQTWVVLARRLRMPVCVGTMERRAPGRHRLVLEPPFLVGAGGIPEEEAMLRVSALLERRVRARPEEWLWMHRRWKIRADWGLAAEATTGDAR